ncbi:MAG: Fpg/Nei family DNA glycosylase [Euzebyales bacterium]|nr:Fpg/Nei family DNA glycosylase [Euzebyales bacterium]
MPEGHTIHRYAREHSRLLVGGALAVSSPQGRFAAGAALLDGRLLARVDPYGKHLFYRWEPDLTLHVHLGLYGGFRTFAGDVPPPTPGTRLQVDSGVVTVRLAGPTACELLAPGQEEHIRARLGPDPLRRGADREAVWAALQRRSAPIGAALMDQSVVAGVGNVFRAEALFACRIDPLLPSRSLDRQRFEVLWATLVRMLREGVRAGRIVTVDPADVGKRSRRALAPDEWRYVYRRAGRACRCCGAEVVASTLAARWCYACPVCQAG